MFWRHTPYRKKWSYRGYEHSTFDDEAKHIVSMKSVVFLINLGPIKDGAYSISSPHYGMKKNKSIQKK